MNAAENTDIQLWKEKPGDYYSPSISSAKDGAISINVGGLVITKDVKEWHALGKLPDLATFKNYKEYTRNMFRGIIEEAIRAQEYELAASFRDLRAFILGET